MGGVPLRIYPNAATVAKSTFAGGELRSLKEPFRHGFDCGKSMRANRKVVIKFNLLPLMGPW
jgi:hypothetical protein